MTSESVSEPSGQRVSRHGFLNGYIVIDLTRALAGPSATLLLADLGATVIRIESPDGDPNRDKAPFATPSGISAKKLGESDVGISYLKRNGGKLSVGIDLKSARGYAAFRQLVQKSDALVHNFRPGVDERLGIGIEQMRKINPRLVYCSMQGLGAYRECDDERAINDTLVQAISGVMSVTGECGGPAVRCGAPIADMGVSPYAALAVVCGLLERDGAQGTGKGRALSVSMLGALSYSLWGEHVDLNYRAGLPQRRGSSLWRTVPFNSYPTSDGGWVVIGAPRVMAWRRLCEATGIPELTDVAYENPAYRIECREIIDSHLVAWTKARTRDDILETMRRFDVSATLVNSIGDLLDDSRFCASMLYEVRDWDGNRTGVFGARVPIADAEAEAAPASPIPAKPCAHTQSVFRDIVRLPPDEVAELLSTKELF